MNSCGVCEGIKETPHHYAVFTGRVLAENSTRDWAGTTTTTSYGDFEKHNFEVCKSCHVKWNFILPMAVYVLSVVLLKLFLLSTEGWDAALFLGLIPAVIVIWKYVIVHRRLIKKAIAQREMQLPGRYKGYITQPVTKGTLR